MSDINFNLVTRASPESGSVYERWVSDDNLYQIQRFNHRGGGTGWYEKAIKCKPYYALYCDHRRLAEYTTLREAIVAAAEHQEGHRETT